MAPIITITFNPCIDKSTTVPSIVPEKKLRCTEPKFEPGGGGINVARAIKKLGGDVRAIYPSGGYSGKFLNTLLKDEGIETAMVETKSHTRENLIVLDTSTNCQYRFGMPGSFLSKEECMLILKHIETAENVEFVVASGSLSPGIPVDIFKQVAAIAKKKNTKFIADTSGDALKFAVQEGVYLVKPNLGELSSLIGVDRLDFSEAADAAKTLIHQYGCEIVIVSMGAEGALMVTATEALKVKAPPVEKKSTVGAGDSMVAGIVQTLLHKKSLKEVVRYGVACGTAATMNAGTELCRLQDVEMLLPQIKVEQF